MIDLTPIMEAIIALVVAVITAFVIPWLKGKIDADKLEQIKLWVTVAVEAAEQLYNGTGRGEEKKAYVVKFLQGKGALMAFFTFLPAIGEVIAIALGFMRSNTWLTIVSMFVGKLIRYILLLYVLESAWNVVAG